MRSRRRRRTRSWWPRCRSGRRPIAGPSTGADEAARARRSSWSSSKRDRWSPSGGIRSSR
jgi:hypothetical protein